MSIRQIVTRGYGAGASIPAVVLRGYLVEVGIPRFEYASHGEDICARCGIIYPERKLKKEWTGLKVCENCFDPRHRQDFVRGVPDKQTIEGARPDPEPVYLTVNEVSADDL